MKKYLILCAGIAALIAAPAGAAELPVKMPLKAPPAPPPAPVYDWSGIYFGGSLGWAEQKFNWAFPGFASFPLKTDQPGAFGLHAGLQWQWSWLVLGGEVGVVEPTQSDFSASVADPSCRPDVCEARLGTVLTYGGKAGIAWGDTLIYGVGGGASGRVDTQIFAPTFMGNGQFDTANDTLKNGWFAGGGLDYMMLRTPTADLIVGVEYQHIDLGSKLLLSSAPTRPPGLFDRTVSAKEDIVWGRLTLKLNWWAGVPGLTPSPY